jgi:murein DD-endopeptidase MepM/ murein hydrolase activator NlpD
VHAGVFSSIANLWSNEVVAQEVVEMASYSAQDTPLLSATLNPDPQKAVGGGDIAVANGALVSTGPVGADEIKASDNGGGEISVYVVREGDALSQIAEMYGVTTNTILWANDLTSAASIKAGDTLVILPFVGVRHEVTSGETLGSILKKYDADLEEVLSYNYLTADSELSVGMELMIPGGEIRITTPTRASYATPTKSSGSTGGGGFTHPAPGSVKTQGIHGYNSVDLAAGHGSAIRAAAAGEVIISKSGGWNGGYGQYIVIRHNNGTQTLYAHLSSNNVGAGAYVSAGQVIGGMGSTGKSTGTHLHFEVRGGRNPF